MSLLPRGHDVAAIVVTWNSMAYLPGCLAGLRRQSIRPHQVVAVDNGSDDGSREWLEQQPDVTLIANPDNLGFAAANNQALRVISSEFALLLNADVVLSPGYVEGCLRAFGDPGVGSVTGKLLRVSPPDTIDSTGHNFFGLGWAENRGELQPDRGFETPDEVFGVCAAAALYRRAALDSVAIEDEYFDETFVSYLEDVDLDFRLRWMGWRARYEPQAVALHHRSATGARFSAPVMREILKNRILTVAKNYDGLMLLRYLPSVVVFTLAKSIDFARRHPSALIGLVDAARKLGDARRKRARLFAMRRARHDEVSAWLRPFPFQRRIARRFFRGQWELGARQP